MIKHISYFKVVFLLALFAVVFRPGSGYAQQTNLGNFYQGLTYYRQGEFEKAIKLLEPVVDNEPNNLNAHFYLASSYLAVKKYDKVIETAAAGLKANPESIRLLLLKAEGYYRTDYKKAIPVYTKLITILQKRDTQSDVVSISRVRAYLGYLYQKKAGELYQSGNTGDAIKSYKKALSLSPDSLSIHNNLAYLYIKTNRWLKAIEVLDKATEKFPKAEKLFFMQGQACRKVEKYEKMLTAFHHLYQLDKNNLNYALVYGQALLIAKEVRKANAFFKGLIEKYPNEKKVYEFLIRINEMRYDFAAKRNILKLERQEFPEDQSIAVELAATHILLEDYTKARQIFDSLATATNQYKYYLQGARTWLFEEKYDTASTAYKRLVTEWPDKGSLLTEAGMVVQKSGEVDQALHFYKSAAKSGNQPRAALRLMEILFDRGEAKQAIKYFKYLENTDFTGVLKYYELKYNLEGLSHHEAMKKMEASLIEILNLYADMQGQLMKKADKAVNLNVSALPPLLQLSEKISHLNNYINKWYGFLQQEFNYKEGSQIISNVLKSYPESSKLYYMKGRLAYQNGKYKISEKALKKAVRLKAEDPEIYFLLAQIYEKRGDRSKAILFYERAITLQPEYEKAYVKIIQLSREQNQLNRLCDRWLKRYKNNRDDEILREYLIEALHKANRFEEAEAILVDGT